MDGSVTVVMTYRPALAFARRAKEWHEATARLDSPHGMGEPPMLVLLYSLLSLEAFISEELSDRRQPPEYHHLYRSNVSLAQRWAKATDLLKASTSPAQHAVTAITAACQDTGLFGLLVRTRNKLIHPRLYVEVGDASGDRIDDDSLERLIKDLQAPPVSLPYFSAAFPGMVTCAASARWSRSTLATMVRLFFDAVAETLPQEWLNVLPDQDV